MADPADRDLALEQFEDLNRQFLAANPPAYFRSRMNALLLSVARPDLLKQALEEGVRIGDVRVGPTVYDAEHDINDPDEHSPDESGQYATTEVVVLIHHASEALLRLFFAVEHGPDCPWLEAARLRGPRAFKDRTDALIAAREDTDQVDRIARWFLGHPATDFADSDGPFGPHGPDALRGTVEFLIMTARRVLGEGNLYNAAKHGLAVLPGERGISLGKGQLSIDLSIDGPSLTFLERAVPAGKEHARWHSSTTWVQLDRSLAWTELVLMQMSSLWSIAKLVYLGQPARVHPVLPDAVAAVLRTDKVYTIDTMSEQLAYYVPQPGRST